jgi:hypothetical protein
VIDWGQVVQRCINARPDPGESIVGNPFLKVGIEIDGGPLALTAAITV